MISRERLETAAFWEQAVCLSCYATIDDRELLDCPTCGERSYPADSLVALVEAFDNEGNDEGET